MKLSIAIPTHDMKDKTYFFTRCLDSLWNQTFQDFEIVVSDNSEDDVLKEICGYYLTGINYFKNPRKGMAPNTNEAIKNSKGEYIKILYMDDFLAHPKALEKIVKRLEGNWLVTGCAHVNDFADKLENPHVPEYNDSIQFGNNTIGSPSVLTIKNEDPLLFDEEMTWLLDCDLYKRYYDKYGEPTILNDINVVIGLHSGQMTHVMGPERKLQEQEYINKKYA